MRNHDPSPFAAVLICSTSSFRLLCKRLETRRHCRTHLTRHKKRMRRKFTYNLYTCALRIRGRVLALGSRGVGILCLGACECNGHGLCIWTMITLLVSKTRPESLRGDICTRVYLIDFRVIGRRSRLQYGSPAYAHIWIPSEHRPIGVNLSI